MINARKRTSVVAGGAGFVGSHLCDALLAEGFRVICIDNFRTGRSANLEHLEREPRFELYDADVIEPLPRSLMHGNLSIDYVFNLACAASPPHYQADPEHTLLTSILGTRHLLAFAESRHARFLLASTSEIYGDPQVHPQIESYWGYVNPTGPRACYDEGKRAAETLAFDFARKRRGEIRVARIFNTYGPRMRADDGRVVSNVITQALGGDDITVYGTGEQSRSFCYVDDLVEGLMRLMAYGGDYFGAVNIGNPAEITVKELAARVLGMTGSQSRIVTRPLPIDDPQRRRPDIRLIEKLVGWTPRTGLDEGLEKTIAYFAAEAEKLAAAVTSKVPRGVRGGSRLLRSRAPGKVEGASVP